MTFEEESSFEAEGAEEPIEARPEFSVGAQISANVRNEQTTQQASVEPVESRPIEAAIKESSDGKGRETLQDSQGSIELESDIFQFDLDGRPAQEVSSTGLENLPGAQKHVSSIDGFRLDGVASANQVDSFKIDLGEEANQNQSEVDSASQPEL